MSAMGKVPGPDAVLINANENPLGPSKAACAAIAGIAPMGGRYDQTGIQAKFVETFAAQHGLKAENIAVYICEKMQQGLNQANPVEVAEVKVWETEIQSATYRPQSTLSSK